MGEVKGMSTTTILGGGVIVVCVLSNIVLNNNNNIPTNPPLTQQTAAVIINKRHPPLSYNNTPNSIDNRKYSWAGTGSKSIFLPPPGVPLYTPRHMRQVFSQQNTLWFGDSN